MPFRASCMPPDKRPRRDPPCVVLLQSAALSRVTLVGRIVPVEKEELPPLKTAFSIVHSYSERLVESPKFSFCKVRTTCSIAGCEHVVNDTFPRPVHAL